MTKDVARQPARTKLRSSCDCCGIAKVKCNREKPQCGRCASHHLECVYGVSRKMGKPPRKRSHDAMTRASLDYGDNYYRRQHQQHQAHLLSRRSGTISSDNGSVADLHEQFRTMQTAPDASPWQAVTPPWDPVDINACSGTDPVATGVDILDAARGNYASRPRMPVPDFAPLDMGEWPMATDHPREYGIAPDAYFDQITTPDSLDMESYSWSPVDQESMAAFDHGSVSSCGATSIPTLPTPMETSTHDCTRQAYEVLESLNGVDGNSTAINPIMSPSSSPRSSVVQDAPLDRILLVNNKATEQLGSLLSCSSCMQSSHFVLLCASIISRVLAIYQQAAAYTQVPSWSTNTFCDDNTAACAESVATKIAIGTFNVDNVQVQEALKVQLLSGEMIRAGHLIDQFGSQVSAAGQHICTMNMPDDFALGGKGNFLGNGLGSWLKSEHTSIGNMLRMKLTELNA